MSTLSPNTTQHIAEDRQAKSAPHDATRATNETRVVILIVGIFLVYVVFLVHYLNATYLPQ